jgi:quinoprotein glucose dehydrogenase
MGGRAAAGLVVSLLGFAISRGLSAPPGVKPYTTWSDYGGSADSSHYSALDQINKENVAKFVQVWFYPAPGPSNRFAFNPVIADNFMYVLKPGGILVSLNGMPLVIKGKPLVTGVYSESKTSIVPALKLAA